MFLTLPATDFNTPTMTFLMFVPLTPSDILPAVANLCSYTYLTFPFSGA